MPTLQPTEIAAAAIFPWCIRCRAVCDSWTLDYAVEHFAWPILAATRRDFPINYLTHHGERWREDAAFHAGIAHWPPDMQRVAVARLD